MAQEESLPRIGHAGNKVLDRLLNEGWKFDFFRAVWLIERFFSGGGARVGGRGPVAHEALRFRPHVSLGFPPTDLRRVSRLYPVPGEAPVYRFDVTFMGLYGVSTPLPLHYAVDILRSVDPYEPETDRPSAESEETPARPAAAKSDSTPVRDFLDIFHHRVLSFFYRAWTKYRFDMTFGMPGRDDVTDYMLRLIGCPSQLGAQALGVSPVRMIRYAGILTQHPKSAVTLEGMISDYWEGLPVRVLQAVGRWVTISDADLNKIGVANTSSGVDLTVGSEVYDLSGAFSVSIGPVDWQTYLGFLPDGHAYAETRALVMLHCTDPMAFTFEITLLAGEVPETRLTSGPDAARLGFTSWIRTEELGETTVVFDAGATPPMRAMRQESDRADEPEREDDSATTTMQGQRVSTAPYGTAAGDLLGNQCPSDFHG